MQKTMPTYSKIQLSALVVLRISLGWYLLYEGLTKLLNPYWTSANYLIESKWIFSELFTSIATNPVALSIVDSLNEWALIAIGLALILGCFTRIASMAGVILLLFYYVSSPPFIGLSYSMPAEGSYLIVNKTLIEMFALFVLYVFPTGSAIGLDVFLYKLRNNKDEKK